MKLSFSTNGWNGFTWEDFYTMAKDLGFAGIEIHDVKEQTFQGANGPLTTVVLPIPWATVTSICSPSTATWTMPP